MVEVAQPSHVLVELISWHIVHVLVPLDNHGLTVQNNGLVGRPKTGTS